MPDTRNIRISGGVYNNKGDIDPTMAQVRTYEVSEIAQLHGGSAPTSAPSGPHPRPRGPKVRVWFGEYHNSPKDSDVICDDLARFRGTDWLPKQVLKYNGQFEKGETGHIHLQFVVRFDNSYYASDVHRYLGMDPRHCWIEKLKCEGGWEYPKKEETRIEGPWTFERSRKRNASEIEDPTDLMTRASKETKKEFLFAQPVNVYTTLAHAKYWDLVNEALEPYTGMPRLYWRWGAPRTGKTKWALRKWSEEERLYTAFEGRFLDKVRPGQHVMLLDESEKDGARIPWGWMLRMLNPCAKTYPVKGTMLPWVFDTVVVMTNKPPMDVIVDPVIMEGIYERIKESGGTIIKCTKDDITNAYSEQSTDPSGKPLSEPIEVTWSKSGTESVSL